MAPGASAMPTRGMTRRVLADDSGVSERYLAQLETGQGNPSIAVLHDIAMAMGCGLQTLIASHAGGADRLVRVAARMAELGSEELRDVEVYLDNHSPSVAVGGRARRIALIGLRGAGKTTLGRRLSAQLKMPFIELNRCVETEYGASVGELLALSGQPAFQRLERRCLETTIRDHDSAVIAGGGGIVADAETFALLLARIHCIWIKARPEEHMGRVLDQGDLRPMAENAEAMRDLEQTLTAREPAYRRAEAVVDTTGEAVDDSAQALYAAAMGLLDVS